MLTVPVPFSDDILISLRKTPREVEREMRLAVAIRWYAQGLISQGTGAEIAGLSRAEFMRSLSEVKVSPFQETAEEVFEAAGLD